MKALLLLLTAFLSIASFAQLSNGSFENNLADWGTIGTSSGDKCDDGITYPGIQTFTTIPGIPQFLFPRAGNYLLRLLSGGTVGVHQMEASLNVSNNKIDTINPTASYDDNNNTSTIYTNMAVSNALNGSAIYQDVYGYAGQTLTFFYLMASEETPEYWYSTSPDNYIDYSFITVSGPSTDTAYYLTCMAEYANCSVIGNFGNPFGTPTTPFCGDSLRLCPTWYQKNIPITADGNYRIGIGIINGGDNLFNSELYIDQLSLHSAPVLNTTEISTFTNVNLSLDDDIIEASIQDNENDTLINLTINTLPANGDLYQIINGSPVLIGSGTLPLSIQSMNIDSVYYVPDNNFVGDDSFEIRVQDGQGDDSNPENVVIHVIDPNASISASDDIQFGLNPNPAHERIEISFNGMENAHFEVTLCDVNGKTLLVTHQGQIDISGLSTGVYPIFIRYEGIVKTLRVVKN